MGAVGLQTYIWNNRLKSVLLLLGFPVLLLLIIFGVALIVEALNDPEDIAQGFRAAWRMVPSLIPIALIGAGIWFVIAWFANQKIIDLVTGARPVTRAEQPRVWNLLENLCISRGITMPALRIIDTPARNAYASGVHEKQYSITVTRGLIEALDDAELEAVLAHELTHIRNRDVQLLVIAAVFAGVITLVGDLIVRSPRALMRGSAVRSSRSSRSSSSSSNRNKGGGAVIVLIVAAIAIFLIARLLAIILQFALSRKREYLADAGSVELTKNPDAMIMALRKIEGQSEVAAPTQVRAMFLDNPKAAGFAGLFGTHPSIFSRVEALVRYAAGRDLPVSPRATAPMPTITAEADAPIGPRSPLPDLPLPNPLQKGPWS